MAWKRGTQVQQAKELRMGQVKEFLAPSSAETATADERVELRVVAAEKVLGEEACAACTALVSVDCRLPVGFGNERVMVHAHGHPSAVVRLARTEGSPLGSDQVALSEAQRLNSRVCEDQVVAWTLYRGRHVAADAREGAIGDTTVDVRPDPRLETVVCEVKTLGGGESEATVVSAPDLTRTLARECFDCVVSLHEVLVVSVRPGLRIACRVIETVAERDDDDDGDDDAGDNEAEDEFRGVVTASTVFYVTADPETARPTRFDPRPEPFARKSSRVDAVEIECSDGEVFYPIRRTVLRPCVSLTHLVQAGKGKYPASNRGAVPVDCCTFDRVLLYLLHVAKTPNTPWKFDPTLAADLLRAADQLGVAGLADACRRVLGSFEERVRKEPIRLAEIKRRNHAGGLVEPRSETLLVIDSMVLDVSRWLYEHPGGASIIPEQGLDVDATVMFELYHASRNSFLYLKEFYIGELALEDRSLLPLPNAHLLGGSHHHRRRGPDERDSGVAASPAFLTHLRSFTTWRLKAQDLTQVNHKSF